jgi:hypothetical protein
VPREQGIEEAGDHGIRQIGGKLLVRQIFKGPDFSQLTFFVDAGRRLTSSDLLAFQRVSASPVWHLVVITVAILQWPTP